MAKTVAVIMAGGSGTRFWPMSTRERPKQFVSLFDSRSLLRLSFDRVAGWIPPGCVMVITARDYVPLVRTLLPELPPENVIGEPVPRDTAGAVGLACALVRRRHPGATLAILTADHLIHPVQDFRRALAAAVEGAENSGEVYTFGIEPTYPATSYGYLERGEKIVEDPALPHYQLGAFREKPGEEVARSFVESGRFMWNSGMFVWPVERLWTELEDHLPAHARLLGGIAARDGEADFEMVLDRDFPALEKISVDYALMEKIRGVRMLQVSFEWKDVGGWLALEPYLPADGAGNVSRGAVAAVESSGNIVFSEDPREMVGLVGVKDLVVVRSGDRTLVAHRHELEKIKQLVEKLRADDRMRRFS